jgi:hypothetical protein
MKMFKWKSTASSLTVNPEDAYALIKYKNGKTEKQEFYFGTSFLSQSARFITDGSDMTSITIYDNFGHQRSAK